MDKSAVFLLVLAVGATIVHTAPVLLNKKNWAIHSVMYGDPLVPVEKQSGVQFSNGVIKNEQNDLIQMEQRPEHGHSINPGLEDNNWVKGQKHGDSINMNLKLVDNEQAKGQQIEALTEAILKEYKENKDVLHKLGIAWSCDVCIVMVKLIQEVSEVNWTKNEIASLGSKVCVSLKIEDDRVCKGIVHVFRGEVLGVLSKVILQPQDICGRAFGSTCASPYNPEQMWSIPLPDIPKPPVLTPQLPQPGSPTMRVLHLTDVHIDNQYTENSSQDCGEPICCRREDGQVETGGAPKWGSYKDCDMPWRTLENLFQHLADNETFDYIVFTGDIPAHYVWESTKYDTSVRMRNLTDMFLKYFPGKPVYNSLGNHEGVPVNSFPPPFKVVPSTERSDWLYDIAIATWRHWLPRDTFTTIKRGGFYTTLVKPGLRIVSLNMNFANSMNWWLMINMTDPVGELSWLVSVLQEAETKGEKVQIIGHIPPGLCTKAWSWAFYEIVNRYESTIVGQFYGHTHTDFFEIFYDPETNLTRPTSVAYIAPSVEAGSSGNNGYRVYTMDGERTNSTWQILDHETHIMNLSKANAGGSPRWFKSYSAKALYNMSSLLPKDWDDLIQRMDKDQVLFDQYYKNVHKQHVTGSCDGGCRKNVLCGLKSARPGDNDLCRNLNVTETENALWREKQVLC